MTSKTGRTLAGGYRPWENPGLILGYDELAKAIGVSRRLLEKLVSKRQIPHKKVGNRVIFYWPEIEKWLVETTAPRRRTGT